MNIPGLLASLLLVFLSVAILAWLLHQRDDRREREVLSRARGEPAPPVHWTAAEAVTLVTALGTLVTSTATGVTSAFAERNKGVVAARDAALRELPEVRDSTRKLLFFRPATWYALPDVAAGAGGVIAVDDRMVRGDCSKLEAPLGYRGTGPGVLECDSGVVRLLLPRGARVLLTMAKLPIGAPGAGAAIRAEAQTPAKPPAAGEAGGRAAGGPPRGTTPEHTNR